MMRFRTPFFKAVVVVLASSLLADAWMIVKPQITASRDRAGKCASKTQHALVNDWASLVIAVEVFDGSQIVDPVVVSNVFWSSLQAKLLSVVIGQLIATIVFGLITSLAAKQIGNIGTFLSEKVFSQEPSFRKMPDSSPQRLIQLDFGKLLICLLIDTVGSSSELIPVFGEITDVIWAPIAGLLMRYIFKSNILFGLEFIEEILPFTDFLPLATICWVVETFFGDSVFAKLLNLDQINTIYIPSKSADDRQGRRGDLEERKD